MYIKIKCGENKNVFTWYLRECELGNSRINCVEGIPQYSDHYQEGTLSAHLGILSKASDDELE